MLRIFTTMGQYARDAMTGRITSGAQLSQRVYEDGYDGIELHMAMLDMPKAAPLLEGLDPAGLTFHSNQFEFSLGSVNRYRRRAAIEQLRDELDYAAMKGARVLTFHPGFEAKKSTRAQSHDWVIASLAEVIESHGEMLRSGQVVLGLENMDSSPEKLCRDEAEIARVLDAHPELSLTCDLAHCAIGRLDIDRFVDRFRDRIRHVHVSGYIPGKSHGKVSLAQSRLNLSPYIRKIATAADGKRDIAFCIENKTPALSRASRKVLQAVRDAL